MVRYLFGLPFALAYLMMASGVDATVLPIVSLTFLLSGRIAGILQIVATFFYEYDSLAGRFIVMTLERASCVKTFG